MSEGSVTMEPLREALGKVINRWYRVGLLRFNSHDDGSDDLLLRDELYHDAIAALAAPAGLDAVLPTFEVGQVVGDLQPGRRRHDWCSIHGDIGPMESIDAHARKAHGSGAEDIRQARKVLKRAARLVPPSGEQEGEPAREYSGDHHWTRP